MKANITKTKLTRTSTKKTENTQQGEHPNTAKNNTHTTQTTTKSEQTNHQDEHTSTTHTKTHHSKDNTPRPMFAKQNKLSTNAISTTEEQCRLQTTDKSNNTSRNTKKTTPT